MCCAIYTGLLHLPLTRALLWGVVHCLNVSRHLLLAKVSVNTKVYLSGDSLACLLAGEACDLNSESWVMAAQSCVDCRTQRTPAWRRLEGDILCNKCWCRRKSGEWKALRAANRAAGNRRRGRSGPALAASVAAAPAAEPTVQRSKRSAAANTAAAPAADLAAQCSTQASKLEADIPAATPADRGPPMARSLRSGTGGVAVDPGAVPTLQRTTQSGSAGISAVPEDGLAAQRTTGVKTVRTDVAATAPAAEPVLQRTTRLGTARAAPLQADASTVQPSMLSDAAEPASIPGYASAVQRSTRASTLRTGTPAANPAAVSNLQRITRSGAVKTATVQDNASIEQRSSRSGHATRKSAAEPTVQLSSQAELLRSESPATALAIASAAQRFMRSTSTRSASVPDEAAAVQRSTWSGPAEEESAVVAPAADLSIHGSTHIGAASEAAAASREEPTRLPRAAKLAAPNTLQGSGQAAKDNTAAAPAQAKPIVRLRVAPTAVTDRARRLNARARAAGDAAAASIAQRSPVARLRLPSRAAKPAAPQARQGDTQRTAAAARAAEPAARRLPRAATLAVARARHMNRSGAASSGAEGTQPKRYAAVKHRLLSRMAQTSAERPGRQRRLTWRLQEALEDPHASFGITVASQNGACASL
jgi:hypothetical protein